MEKMALKRPFSSPKIALYIDSPPFPLADELDFGMGIVSSALKSDQESDVGGGGPAVPTRSRRSRTSSNGSRCVEPSLYFTQVVRVSCEIHATFILV